MEDKQKKRLLAVCTGNTCRSPMAAAVLARILTEKGLTEAYTADSAGVAAFDGQPASPNAVTAAQEEGLDLSAHLSHRITLEEIVEAERIFVMSEEHRALISKVVPGSSEKIAVMQLPDPYGGDLEEYRRCLGQIKAFFVRFFEENPLCAE